MSNSHNEASKSKLLSNSADIKKVILPKALEDISFEAILKDKKALLQKALPEVYKNLHNSDPAVALLEVSSYTEGLFRNRINSGLLSVMLDYATGNDLESLGKLFGIERKKIKEADESQSPVVPAVFEDDEDLRARIIAAPKGFSVAGPRSAYMYYGKSADAKVKDITAFSSSPMEVNITVLSYEGNGSASKELIDTVYNKLNAEDVRPMGDLIRVKGAEIINFELDLKILFKQNHVIDKKAVIAQVEKNLNSYVNSEHKLEGFVSQAGIYACSFLDSVDDVVIKSPIENIKTSIFQAPFCNKISVTELKEKSDG